MPTKDQKPSKLRKKIADIVTRDSIKAENMHLNLQLRATEQEAPGPETKAEGERREKILQNAYIVAGTAALAYLHNREPAAYFAIIRSTRAHLTEMITKGTAEFSIRPARPSDGFWARVQNQYVLAAYKHLMERLQPVWRVKPEDDKSRRTRESAGRTFRLGEAQESGLRRRQLHLDARAAAIRPALDEFLPEDVLTEKGIDEEVIHRWARQATASEACRIIVAYLLGVAPRQIKSLINRAPKQAKEAAEQIQILESRK